MKGFEGTMLESTTPPVALDKADEVEGLLRANLETVSYTLVPNPGVNEEVHIVTGRKPFPKKTQVTGKIVLKQKVPDPVDILK